MRVLNIFKLISSFNTFNRHNKDLKNNLTFDYFNKGFIKKPLLISSTVGKLRFKTLVSVIRAFFFPVSKTNNDLYNTHVCKFCYHIFDVPASTPQQKIICPDCKKYWL